MRTMMTEPPSEEPSMTPEASMALADKILRDAGWTPVVTTVAVGGAREANTAGRFAFGNLVCGHPPPGATATYAGKELTKVPQALAASFGFDPADYPDEHHEAALWLAEKYKPFLPLTVDADGNVGYDVPHERVDSEPAVLGPGSDGAGQAVPDGVLDAAGSATGDGDGAGLEGASGAGDRAHEGAAGEGADGDGVSTGGDGAGDAVVGELGVTDADFAEVEDPLDCSVPVLEDATLFPERGIAWSEEDEPEAEPDTTGPIAYAASDLDALVREKLGRVSQIARELKAALQDGWTIDEFRSLQNLIVRIDRGEATDDAQARARFVAISERSQAMSRVDAHRDALEAALEVIGKARDYQGAKDFDPEQGWP